MNRVVAIQAPQRNSAEWLRHLIDASGFAIAGSAIFLGLYTLCNWLTSLRPNVPTWQFAWERHIPFLPWMMWPYLSEDVLFVAAFFVCADRREMARHLKRIAAANVIAAACFLAFPLRMAAHRPEHFDGFLRPFVWLLYTLDRPFNLVPSLHIAQGLLVWVIFARHTRPPLRWVIHGWFVLIGVSTLFTWQHGMPDLATGLMLGMLCWWMFPDRSEQIDFDPVHRNARVGWRWTTGAAVMLGLAYLLHPWGWLLAWPAFACAVVAAAYFHLGPAVFGKSAGLLPPATRFLFLPAFAATRLGRMYLLRGSEPWVRVLDNLLIGRRLTNRQARMLVTREHVSAVLDLTAECGECRELLTVPYLNLQLLDLTVPTPGQFQQAVHFIQNQSRGGVVYVHCAMGYSRASVIAAAYLLDEGVVDTVEDAIRFVRRIRPQVVLKQDSIEALKRHSTTIRADRAGTCFPELV